MTEGDLNTIIKDCQKGSRKSQEQLYRHSYEFAMTIAMRYARDEHQAADIMSLAFVKMFRSIASFNSLKGNFYGWLKRIIINEALDCIKIESRFNTQELEAAEEPFIHNSVVDRIDAAGIMHLIRQLPPATHAVFVLFAIDGFTHKEIAENLKIKEGTSKWHLSEARKILQQKLTMIKYSE